MADLQPIVYKRSAQEIALRKEYAGQNVAVASDTLSKIYPQYQHFQGGVWKDPKTGIGYRRVDFEDRIELRPIKGQTKFVPAPGFTGRAGESHVSPFSEQAQSIEVTTHTGEKKEITREQAKEYTEASGEAQFNQAKNLGLIPRESTFVEGKEGSWGYIEKSPEQIVEGAKERIKTVEIKRDARQSLEKYKAGENEYYIARALADGVDRQTLLAAGYTKKQLVDPKLQKEVDYLKSTPQQKLAILVEQGKAPKNAELVKVDKDGTLHYKVSKKETPLFPGGGTVEDYQQWKVEQSVSDKVTPPQRNKDAVAAYQKVYQQEVAENLKDGVIGLTPIYGTVHYWKEMSPGWKAASIAGDLLFLSLIAKPLITSGVLSRTFLIGGKAGSEAKVVANMLKQDLAASRSTLKAVDPKLVKPFNNMVKARAAYADNLANIKTTEGILKEASGEVVPEVQRHLSLLRQQTGKLANRLDATAKQFTEAQSAAIKRIKPTKAAKIRGVAGKAINQPGYDASSLVDSGFTKDIVRDTRQLVEAQFGKVPSTGTIDRQIIKTAKAIDSTKRAMAKAKTASGLKSLNQRLSNLNTELLKYKSQKAVAESGGAYSLATKLAETRLNLEAAKRNLQNSQYELMRQPTSERDLAGIVRRNKEIVERLAREEAETTEEYIKALKKFDIIAGEPGEPIPRSGGRTIVTTGKYGTKTPRFVGGGSKAGATPGILTLAALGAKVSATSGDWLEFSYTPQTIEVAPGQRIQTGKSGEVEPETIGAPRVREFISPGGEPAPAGSERTSSETETNTKVKTQAKVRVSAVPATTPTTTPVTVPATEPVTPTTTTTKIGTDKLKGPPGGTGTIPPRRKKDEEARSIIKGSDGAIAWRMGKVGKKDRWDVVVYPYTSKEQYLMVLGSRPKGATIVRRGKGSARATAQMLRGKAPKRTVRVDSGFQDIIINPTSEKSIAVDFRADPKLQTIGDITIGFRRDRIGGRMPRITGRQPRISPKPARISR